MHHYDAHISLLSINLEECANAVVQLHDLLRCLLAADCKKRSEWVCLEELVVQRARAEVRYHELRAHVKAFHDVKSPVKTSFIAKDMMDSFNRQGLLSPNPAIRKLTGVDTVLRAVRGGVLFLHGGPTTTMMNFLTLRYKIEWIF